MKYENLPHRLRHYGGWPRPADSSGWRPKGAARSLSSPATRLSEGEDSARQGTVVEVIKEGYCLHDRLLRPAEVVVSVSAEAHE
jgi:hypothetical protein